MKVFLAIGLLVTGWALAAERPTIPEPCVDQDLLKVKKDGKDVQLTPAEFFSQRTSNTACMAELKGLKDDFEREQTLLEAKVKAGGDLDAMDDQGEVVQAALDRLVAKMPECGACAARDIEKRTVYGSGPPEFWYIADGSCYLPAMGFSAETIKKIYATSVKRLQQSGRYAKQGNGFPSILDFYGVDRQTGARLPDGPIKSTPFAGFFALMGPQKLGITSSFTYFADSTLTSVHGQPLTDKFEIRFNSMKGTPPAEVYETLPSKRTRKIILSNRHLSLVLGKWCVNEEGYYRYFTAADFGRNFPFAESFANKSLLEALFTLTDQSTKETP